MLLRKALGISCRQAMLACAGPTASEILPQHSHTTQFTQGPKAVYCTQDRDEGVQWAQPMQGLDNTIENASSAPSESHRSAPVR